MASTEVIKYAPNAWRLLNGVFCIYKPAGINIHYVRNTLIGNLCRDLNAMDIRPPRDYVKIEGSLSSGEELTVSSVPSYSDNVLVVGRRYQMQDFRVQGIHLGKYTSGVCIMGVNNGCKIVDNISSSMHLRTYELKGQFGFATDTFMEDGKVIHKATYRHINHSLLDIQLAAVQASHQKNVYKYAEVDLASQGAYELASKGIIRPSGKSPPIIYGIKCTEFDLPCFTLEISCINEHQNYLTELILEIGLALKSCAVCKQIRQIRYGEFTLDHALVRKHWTLNFILNNIEHCKPLVASERIVPASPYFEPRPVQTNSDISLINNG